MKQFSYSFNDMDGFENCLKEFLSVCPAGYESILVSVFTRQSDHEYIRRITDRLDMCLPKSEIVGTIASGGIKDGELSLAETMLTFMVFNDTRLKVIAYDGSKIIPQAAGMQFLRLCNSSRDLKGIEVLATLAGFDIQAFFDELTTLPEEVRVFGGSADNYELGFDGFVFTKNNILKSGIVTVCFLGSTLDIHVDCSFGWKPLGRPMKITATDGNLIIRELDHLPAVSVYEKYLKIVPGPNFHKDALEFPLLLERNGVGLARLPDAYREEDGALVFIADCYEGEYVRLAYGEPSEILSNTREIQASLATMSPEAVMVFSCVTRRIFLGDDVRLELEHYGDIAPTAGLYTHGEFNRLSYGKVQVLNMTLVSVLMREGEPHKTMTEIREKKQPHLKKSMSLAQRMARFITVTALELEEAHQQLAIMARQDRLTKLLTRNEVEEVLKRHIAEYNGNLSAIMLDLDNFKFINENYGHDEGDQVLVATAKAITGSIRPSDAGGRWAGEEFLVVLPGVNLNQAALIAERMRDRISRYHLDEKNVVTACFGAATVHKGEEYRDFYRRLDANLREAKRIGENKVVAE